MQFAERKEEAAMRKSLLFLFAGIMLLVFAHYGAHYLEGIATRKSLLFLSGVMFLIWMIYDGHISAQKQTPEFVDEHGLIDLMETLENGAVKPRCFQDTYSEIRAFQEFGGIFGGALAVENLAPLDLTAEQKEKVVKVVEKVNRERFELFHAWQMEMRKPEADLDLEIVQETIDKIVSLTRGGQKEIETILTDEQKRRAEELMADVPEEICLLSDYLIEHP